MPVELRSPSPEPYERSPSPTERPDASETGPSKKPRLTVADIQKRKLDKLLANPEKEVKLPEGMGLRMGVRAPKELLKNVTGSSAASGSGDFHVYKHSRRREYERVKAMERQTRELEEQAHFLARQQARDAEAEAKTAKNRAKRQKRKAGRRGGGAAGAGDDDERGTQNAKSKLSGAPGVVSNQPSDGNEAMTNGETAETINTAAEVRAAQEAAVAQAVEGGQRAEVQITVHDDE